ncbi:hypothetical protein [Propionibacterium freudenreichii]|nr:hypothetical protein [Propionibacterium freudenreichii]SCQ46792.1 Hypothetical protein PFR_JS7-1_1842 [Propionibacterium freudenreichii]SCQ56328.1 Hypothetical protein PFR_JS7-PH_7 [Propionibacterium freudenreichii]
MVRRSTIWAAMDGTTCRLNWTQSELTEKNRRMVALDVLARQIELAHYPQIREWRGNGRPTCARCGSSWPCQRARDAVRLREIIGGGDDPGDDGARDLIPEVTAQMPTTRTEPATGATQ